VFLRARASTGMALIQSISPVRKLNRRRALCAYTYIWAPPLAGSAVDIGQEKRILPVDSDSLEKGLSMIGCVIGELQGTRGQL